MPVTLAMINMKGGVGKSTLTVNLAWQFYYLDKKVLVVDLDPQFNASQYMLGVTKYKNLLAGNGGTSWDILEQNTTVPGSPRREVKAESVIHNVQTAKDGSCLHLIPARLELAYTLRSPAGKEELLAKFLRKHADGYDLILIDCPPTESLFTLAAYHASDFILVPVRPEYLSSIGLPLLARSMNDFRDQHDGSSVQLAGIVFNSTTDYSPEEGKAKNEVKELAAKHGWHVFPTEIGFSRSYPKGAREGKPIFHTSYSRANHSSKLRRFADELSNVIGLSDEA